MSERQRPDYWAWILMLQVLTQIKDSKQLQSSMAAGLYI